MVSLRSGAGFGLAMLLAVLWALRSEQAQAGIPSDASPPILTIDALAQLADIDVFGESADGRQAVVLVRRPMLTRNDYDLSWYLVPTLDGTPPRKLGGGGDPMFREIGSGSSRAGFRAIAPAWSSNGAWIAFAGRDGASAFVSVTDRRTFTQWTVKLGDEDIVELKWSSGADRLYFRADRSRQNFSALVEKEGVAGYLFDERFVPFITNRPVRRPENAGVKSPSLWVIDAASRTTRSASSEDLQDYERLMPPESIGTPAEPNSARSRVSNIASSDDGQRVAWLQVPAEELSIDPPVRVHAGTRNGTGERVCLAPQCRGWIEQLQWLSAGEVFFVRREGMADELTALYAWNPRRDRVRTLLRTTEMLSECQARRSRILCLHEGPTRPQRLVEVNSSSGSISGVYDPNPAFAASSFGHVRRLIINVVDGSKTLGMLVTPVVAAKRRLPLVITTYSCRGFLRGATGDEYPIHPLAQAGFAVLCLNSPSFPALRARATSVEELNQALRNDNFENQAVVSALQTTIAQLAAEGVIDPNQVAMTGLSFGSELTHYAMFHLENLAAAIASGVGMDPISYYLGGDWMRAALVKWGMPAPKGDGVNRWRQVALSLNTERARAAFLINAADSEYVLALPAFTELRDAGVPVEMHVFPNEGHIKLQPVHRLAVYERNIDWLRFWLQGNEDAAPRKAEQYQRWRALRERSMAINGHSADSPRR